MTPNGPVHSDAEQNNSDRKQCCCSGCAAQATHQCLCNCLLRRRFVPKCASRSDVTQRFEVRDFGSFTSPFDSDSGRNRLLRLAPGLPSLLQFLNVQRHFHSALVAF